MHTEIIIGFIMVSYQPIDTDDSEDEDIYYLSIIMIDVRYQDKGYGKASLIKLINYIKTSPLGKAKEIILSSDPKNEKAYNLFKSNGL